ncbi:BREX-1 system adenine-specific DNA-methyltransferase PglX [Microbacterium protaetiae]|uniref:site-specific DNA-methyltransferase (adenine-specific) n=1 Tax=Microbacterium protaetiae TaxID=2509458 RepID=A0A4P6EF79_9MICO|nr:BREX-1 system adenine-specific DNA-methyltransferase PglX [Microbacterium protaetiae]QAY59789.1 BREX-1 system adenine-specific DNA-methyltransferase PglX [Microbacterium protaetiae]
MDTAPLKSFATSARTELIREVGARITAVLAPGSPERVEQPRAVNALEQAIAAAGGGVEGKAHVIDKVAYTWFNRIVGLRFMDANGYTGIGIVSPAADQVGQPEVLAAAKRGQVDGDVVKGATAATVTGLLNGTRVSRPGVDAQAEAYALLLADYCRYWNRAMPFLFEREGDYTELLIPANLLAEDSVLSRSVTVLTEDVCRDVEVIGWLYQFYISERKDEVFAGFKKNKKAGADEIPAATQLFTPHWIVRYLVENSLGRLWMLNHPESRLVDRMDYYIAPVDEEADFLKITAPEELTVIDPACGSGHMLTYAFDLLYAIYEEEGYTPSQIPGLILANNIFGTEIDLRAGSLAAFALTMKATAKRKLFLKNPIAPNICVLEPISFNAEELRYLVTDDGDRHAEEAFWNEFAHADTFGALIQPDAALTVRLGEHLATLEAGGDIFRADTLRWAQRVVEQATYLASSYGVVVANPPYMGSKQMNALLSQFMKDEYLEVKQDLYGAFVLRGIELTDRHGLLAIVIGDTWMSIKSFEALRLRLLDGHAFDSFVHMRDVSNHPDIFGANAAFVLSMSGKRSRHAPFIRLTPLGQERKEENLRVALAERTRESGFHRASGEDFAAIPGSPIVYWLSEKMRAIFTAGDLLGSVASLAVGLQTGDNNRFLRQWWEVSRARSAFGCTSREEAAASGARWYPYNKGGEFRKWYGNQEYVVNWENDGAEIRAFGTEDGRRPRSRAQNTESYFSPSVSWSDISSGEAAFRRFPAGFIHDVKGMSAFGDASLLDGVAVLMNSSFTRAILRAIAPTVNFQIGDVGRVPVDHLAELPSNAASLVATAQMDWDDSETSWEFARNPLVELSECGKGHAWCLRDPYVS